MAGLAKIPIIRYLFSSDSIDHQEDEVLIMLIPHIVRLPELTPANLRTLYTGSEANIQGFRLTIPLQINTFREFGNFPRFGPIDLFSLRVRRLA